MEIKLKITKGVSEVYGKTLIRIDGEQIASANSMIDEAEENAKLISDAINTTNKCGLLPSELLEKLEFFIGGTKDSVDQYIQLAKLTETLLQQRNELLDVTRWYSKFILTANDGGDAWCAVRNQEGATEWANKLKEVMAKYK